MKSKRKRKAAARKKLGLAIVEGRGYNYVMQQVRKAEIEPKTARKYWKELTNGTV